MKDYDNVDLAILALLLLGVGALCVSGLNVEIPPVIDNLATGIAGLATGTAIGRKK